MDKAVIQLSLFDNAMNLAGLIPAVKDEMRRVTGGEDGECRKALVDKMNAIAARLQIKLTGGNSKALSLDSLNKILSPSDTSHPPSLLFVQVFCRAAQNYDPLRVYAEAAGFELMSEQDKKWRDYGKAIHEERQARKKKRKLEEGL